MRVALYQCQPLPLDIPANLQRLQVIAVQAKDKVDLLVLPEMFLTGYNIGAKAVAELAQAQDGDAAQQIAELAKANNMAIVYGYPERAEDGHIYNSVQLIDAQGQRLCNYRKTHLFGELDRTMFSQGPDAFPVVDLEGWKVGLLICYDLEFPENARRLALAGAELIVVPTANMAPYDFRADAADVPGRCVLFDHTAAAVLAERIAGQPCAAHGQRIPLRHSWGFGHQDQRGPDLYGRGNHRAVLRLREAAG